MYRVILVDDERWVLSDVVHSFPWGQYEFEVVGQTTQAMQAIELVAEEKPDVAFLDIRMPVLSGLDLIPLLREKSPRLLFVLITGHSEFEYARTAVRLSVFDYCLKPVEEREAADLLGRLRSALKQRGELPPFVEIDPEESAGDSFSRLLRHVRGHAFEKLSLEKVAEAYYMNPNYCGHLFKLHTGKTYSQYVRDIRMKTACYLLSHSRLRIGEIAIRVGYDNTQYFTRIFTAAMGDSPRGYRAKNNSVEFVEE
ncbi:MAG: response regulator [Clostridiales bacterium]|jgi:YesN/AraC family two-component response regulator|nr:response regulator [Clostridiales bacterium]